MQPDLNKPFKALRKEGYFARQRWQCCSSCGWAAVPEAKTKKAVFYHRQDDEGLRKRGYTYLTWCGDAGLIKKVFEDEGFVVEHDGSENTRILVKYPDAA